MPCPWLNALPAEQRAVPRSAQSLRLSGLALAAPASVVFGEPIAAAILGVLHQLLNRRRSRLSDIFSELPSLWAGLIGRRASALAGVTAHSEVRTCANTLGLWKLASAVAQR